jgi:hypothetical protein
VALVAVALVAVALVTLVAVTVAVRVVAVAVVAEMVVAVALVAVPVISVTVADVALADVTVADVVVAVVVVVVSVAVVDEQVPQSTGQAARVKTPDAASLQSAAVILSQIARSGSPKQLGVVVTVVYVVPVVVVDVVHVSHRTGHWVIISLAKTPDALAKLQSAKVYSMHSAGSVLPLHVSVVVVVDTVVVVSVMVVVGHDPQSIGHAFCIPMPMVASLHIGSSKRAQTSGSCFPLQFGVVVIVVAVAVVAVTVVGHESHRTGQLDLM